MSSPIPMKFKQANHNWLKPENMTNKDCGSLPAFIDAKQSISCWKVPFWQRVKLIFTGRVYLGVIGQQPPVYVLINSPFIETT